MLKQNSYSGCCIQPFYICSSVCFLYSLFLYVSKTKSLIPSLFSGLHLCLSGPAELPGLWLDTAALPLPEHWDQAGRGHPDSPPALTERERLLRSAECGTLSGRVRPQPHMCATERKETPKPDSVLPF